MNKILNGKLIAGYVKDAVKQDVELLKHRGMHPALAVIQVGNHAASDVYVRNKQKACEYVGIKSYVYRESEDISEQELIQRIQELNMSLNIHGILVQLPLPEHMNERHVLDAISPDKDVDGFHPMNAGRLFLKEGVLLPCTAAGILEILLQYHISIDGKRCVVVGRSNIVGNPVAQLLQKENGTVTVVHSHTDNMREITSQADILVVAAGKKGLIGAEDVKDGAVVIDVGIHRDDKNHLSGDVDFDAVYDKVSYITPVPGGVGPMTVAMLMKNCVLAAKMQCDCN